MIQGQAVQLGPWTGGVNFAVPAEDLGPNDIYDGQNVRIGIGGEITKRLGSDTYNTQIGGDPTTTAVGTHRFSATDSKGFAVVGAVFYEDNLSGSLTNRTGSATITAGNDNTFSSVNANGTLLLTNGVTDDTMMKWTASGGNVAAMDVDSRFTTAKVLEFFDNRAWAGNLSSGTDRVWRSDTADINTWGANSFYQFGEDVTGLKRWGNVITVHTENSIHLLIPTGNAATPYRVIQRANAGTTSLRAVENVRIPNMGEVILFVREDGIYMFNGDSSQKISWKLDGERYWSTINTSRLSESFSVVYPAENECWFFLPYGSGQTTMNHIIVFDYVRQIWYPPFTGVERNCAGVINSVPHCGGVGDGFIYKHEQANLYDDDNSTQSGIDAWFETSAPTPHGTDVRNRWLFLRTSYDVEGASEVNVIYTAPSIIGELTTFTQEGGYDSIGTFKIAESSIASNGSLSSVDTDLSGYDSNIKVKYANANAGENYTIRRSMAVYKPIGRKRTEKAGIY